MTIFMWKMWKRRLFLGTSAQFKCLYLINGATDGRVHSYVIAGWPTAGLSGFKHMLGSRVSGGIILILFFKFKQQLLHSLSSKIGQSYVYYLGNPYVSACLSHDAWCLSSGIMSLITSFVQQATGSLICSFLFVLPRNVSHNLSEKSSLGVCSEACLLSDAEGLADWGSSNITHVIITVHTDHGSIYFPTVCEGGGNIMKRQERLRRSSCLSPFFR